ncbi:hypothetical protein ACHAQH_007013 [Verticillium albo-atrum]
MAVVSTGAMLQQIRRCGRQQPLTIPLAIIVLVASFYVLTQASAPWLTSRRHTWIAKESSAPVSKSEDFTKVIADLWKPFILDINATNFTAEAQPYGGKGRYYEMPSKTRQHFSKSLGKDLLILDSDSRDLPQAQTTQRTGDWRSIFDDDQMTPRVAGMLNHQIYAQIHGYDYKFVKAAEYRDRHQTWVKVPTIKELLKEYKVVVFLDSDAVFIQPDVPLEWMMNYWNIHPKTVAAMAEDPNSPTNRDSKGWVLWNTGFIVAQQNERSQEFFRQWEECPSGRQFPDCKRWAYDWAHEQAALGNQVRYAWNKTDELRAIPCMDANGAHHCGDRSCLGVFVSHHWGKKDEPIQDLWRMVTRVVARYTKEGRPDMVFKSFMSPIQPRRNRAWYATFAADR